MIVSLDLYHWAPVSSTQWFQSFPQIGFNREAENQPFLIFSACHGCFALIRPGSHYRHTAISKNGCPCDPCCVMHGSCFIARGALWSILIVRGNFKQGINNRKLKQHRRRRRGRRIVNIYFTGLLPYCTAGYEIWIMHHGSLEQPFLKQLYT